MRHSQNWRFFIFLLYFPISSIIYNDQFHIHHVLEVILVLNLFQKQTLLLLTRQKPALSQQKIDRLGANLYFRF